MLFNFFFISQNYNLLSFLIYLHHHKKCGVGIMVNNMENAVIELSTN